MRMYLTCGLVTGALVAVILAIARADPFHLAFQQYWFMAVLSVLLIHYLLDAYLFAFSLRRGRSTDLPYAALAT
jgi:hypothetical protein